MQSIKIFFDSIFETRPFLLLMFQSCIIATIIKLIFYKFNKLKLQNYIFIPVILLFIYYFGIILLLKTLFVLTALSVFNQKFINNWVISFFILIELYIVLGLLSNPTIALITLMVIGTLLILSSLRGTILIKTNLLYINKFIYSLNIVELFIIILSFIMGSIPQNHYDAIHGNLYSAKTYITTNSLSALPENTGSVFPQNAILYYAFFYQLGQERGLQLSYLLPVFIIFYCLRILKVNYLLVTPILITPIFFFEASSGYYDLLIVSLILTATTTLYTKTVKLKDIFMSAFMVGFAGGGKYFPIFLSILPILQFLKTSTKKIFIIPLVIIIMFPLSLWLVRSYITTNNPVFPFMQNIFPTPKIWDKNDILENNPMIKTPVNLKQWATSAFVYYPIVTYFNTTSFMEALPHYTTVIYILLLPLQIFIAITILSKIYKGKTLNSLEIILICLFLAFYFTGFITRYYRYLWPTQFVGGLFSLLYLQHILKISRKVLIIISIIFICVTVLNIRQIFNHLQLTYNYSSHIFQPDYYQISTMLDNPITVINQITKNNTNNKILDASKYIQGRFHFSPRVFQCNWYWYDKVLDIIKHKNDKNYGKQILEPFDYIITHNPPQDGNNICLDFLLPELPNYKRIYQDASYQIYSTK